jgi:glycosyltransferase involved in cell wall biosynthesis
MIEFLIPYYGDPALLRIAVNSVLDQDDPDWRLVVVDNHYPDLAPGEWVAGLGDPRVTYLRNDRNLGVSGNLRRCLEVSSQTHIVITGADDVVHPNYVSTLKRAIETYPEASMIQPRVRVIDERGRVARPLGDRVKSRLAPPPDRDHTLGGEALAASLLRGNWVYFPALAWRRDELVRRPFRTDMETVFDLDVLMDVVISGGSFVLLKEEAFSYRRHRTSVSSKTAMDTARFEEESRLYAELVPRLEHLDWNAAARRARWHTTSRLHALTLLPRATISRDWTVTRRLLRHATQRTSD